MSKIKTESNKFDAPDVVVLDELMLCLYISYTVPFTKFLLVIAKISDDVIFFTSTLSPMRKNAFLQLHLLGLVVNYHYQLWLNCKCSCLSNEKIIDTCRCSENDSWNWFALCFLNFSVIIADIFLPFSLFIQIIYIVIPVAPSKSILSPSWLMNHLFHLELRLS